MQMSAIDISNKVVYQVYPKSFKDSNGDGWGDLRGVTSKLDYLAELGVDYIWLTPFFPSPQRDNGYDVADYRAVDPRYGTMADFEELSREAHARGIGIMLDMVFNHTSTQHEWYQRALAGEKRYQDYYLFCDGTPDKLPCNWASKFGGPAWQWEPAVGKWRMNLYDPTQADLNWANPEVRRECAEIVLFWKEKGVDGFRFDVVNNISKPKTYEDDLIGDGRRFYVDGPHVHEYLQELVRVTGIDASDGYMTVGEMSSTSLEACLGYTNPGARELSMVFSFHHLKVDYKDGKKWELMPADLGELQRLLSTWQEGMQAGGGWNALFWDNHDQPRVVSRFGDDGALRVESARMLCLFMNLLRGTPYIYQGNELGMTNAHFSSIEQYRDVESTNYFDILVAEGKTPAEALHIVGERSRDNARTPMQWGGGPRRRLQRRRAVGHDGARCARLRPVAYLCREGSRRSRVRVRVLPARCWASARYARGRARQGPLPRRRRRSRARLRSLRRARGGGVLRRRTGERRRHGGDGVASRARELLGHGGRGRRRGPCASC